MADNRGLPAVAEMVRLIEEIVAHGVRRPGYPADQWAEEFIFHRFEALGLEAVRFEPVESAFWRDSPSDAGAQAAAVSTTFPMTDGSGQYRASTSRRTTEIVFLHCSKTTLSGQNSKS